MSIVKERKTFFVEASLNETGVFTKSLDVGFIPDELRIVQVIYVPGGMPAPDFPYSVNWDGIGKLFYFDNTNNVANVNIRINVHGRNIQGTQTFRVVEFNNINSEPHENAVLAFVFEVIKY